MLNLYINQRISLSLQIFASSKGGGWTEGVPSKKGYRLYIEIIEFLFIEDSRL